MPRPIILGILVSSACTAPSSSDPPGVSTGAFRIDEIVRTTAAELRVQVHKQQVPLGEMPMADLLAGLPMTGLADVAIDVVVPIADGARAYRRASGSIAIACPDGCTLGDDAATVNPAGGMQLPFGHLTFDKLELQASIDKGRLAVTRWHAESPDLALQIALRVELATPLEDSTLHGCVRFKASPTLGDRDPRTAAVIATTGAALGADGLSSIQVAGTLGAHRLLGKVCGEPLAK